MGLGLPSFHLVGLGSASVREAAVRVKSAMQNSAFKFPSHRVSVNLSPASLRKEGSHYDLPMAIAILRAQGLIPPNCGDEGFIGELSLDGKIKAVSGVLPMLLAAKKAGMKRIFIPQDNAPEAVLAPLETANIYMAQNLQEIVHHLTSQKSLTALKPLPDASPNVNEESNGIDLASVKGQAYAKRALEIAAAGNHNIIFVGPPGSGKTLLARCLPGILPPLSATEVVEVATIYSIAGLIRGQTRFTISAPFRAPHHTTSAPAIFGGGPKAMPGELSLAHHGVLFMDELPEFDQRTLEALRQPLEERTVKVTRSQESADYPADVLFVAACNPCPCGFFGSSQKPCVCRPIQIERYQKKLSGPLLDRIDLYVRMLPVVQSVLLQPSVSEPSSMVRSRVIAARKIQNLRYAARTRLNAHLRFSEIENYCQLTAQLNNFLANAVRHYALSARGYHRLLRVARTISDLDTCGNIEVRHLAEACQYRVGPSS